MHKLAFLSFVLLPLFSSALHAQKNKSGSAAKSPSPSTLSIVDALDQKKIALSITAIGGHQGESITLTCRSLQGQFLRVKIPQGLLMEPSDSSMQTLVVAEAQSLAVNAKLSATIQLKTFCTQAGDRSPGSGTSFALGAMAPDKLCQLLKLLSDNGKTDDASAQSAVWCITNGHSLASIGDAAVTKFTAELLGKKPPGYRVQYESREVPGERADLGKALIVESNFQYTLQKVEKLSTLLLDAEGKLVKTLRENEPAAAGEHRSGLRLQAWNLKPGKYTVRVQTADKRVIQDIGVEF